VAVLTPLFKSGQKHYVRNVSDKTALSIKPITQEGIACIRVQLLNVEQVVHSFLYEYIS